MMKTFRGKTDIHILRDATDVPPCNGRIIRILHECEVLIEKSVPRVTVWHHEAPRDRFVDQYLKLMIDYFSCTPMSADA